MPCVALFMDQLSLFQDGTTPLMLAASFGQVEVVSLLLQDGADPNIRYREREGERERQRDRERRGRQID